MAEKKTRDDEVIQRQIHTNVVKTLTNNANKRFESGADAEYVAPTEDAIKIECMKRWQEHEDRKGGKKDVSRFFA